MIDISIKLERDNKVWEWVKSQSNKLITAGHVGTHIDVYNKSDVPEEYIRTEGVLVDCSNYDLDEEIGMEVLENVNIKSNDFVIFKTNIQSNNPYGSEIYINKHHQLSWELIDYLLDKKVWFIGIDCAGIRRGKEHFKADIKGEKNKTYIVENLDLSKIDYCNGCRFDVYTIWINNPISTGLSTRVFVK